MGGPTETFIGKPLEALPPSPRGPLKRAQVDNAQKQLDAIKRQPWKSPDPPPTVVIPGTNPFKR